jgi:CRP-like cAMP-binding protein
MPKYDSFKNYLDSTVKLQPKEWEIIEGLIEERNYKSKQFLDWQGEKANSIYFLSSGLVRVYEVREGKEYTHNIYQGPKIVANMAAITTGCMATHNIQTITPCKIFTLNYPEVVGLFDILPKYERIARMLLEKVVLQEIERIQQLTVYGQQERYVMLRDNNPDIIEKVPQRVIASYLCMSPESLCRMKSRLEAEALEACS